MAVIEAFRFVGSSQTALTRIPILTFSGLVSPIMCKNPALFVPSISMTAGIIGVFNLVVSVEICDTEYVLTVPVSGRVTHSSMRPKHWSQNRRGGTTVLSQRLHLLP